MLPSSVRTWKVTSVFAAAAREKVAVRVAALLGTVTLPSVLAVTPVPLTCTLTRAPWSTPEGKVRASGLYRVMPWVSSWFARDSSAAYCSSVRSGVSPLK